MLPVNWQRGKPPKKLVWLLGGAPFVANSFVFVSLPLRWNISLPDLEQK